MEYLNECECLQVSAGIGFNVNLTLNSTYVVASENAPVVANNLVAFLTGQLEDDDFIDVLSANADLTSANITFLEIVPLNT